MQENWLSTRETADRLKVSESTVRRYIQLQLLHAVKHGRRWQIDVESIRRFARDYKGERV